MTKKAVLLAYGYPPKYNGVKDINENLWLYWGPSTNEARINIYFLNNVAYKIERVELGFRGPFGRRSKIHKEELTGIDKENVINEVKLEQNEPVLSEELRNLSELHSSGALTDEEFKKAKEKLLND
ncbi:MAG: SHOCT domain-containing protein [Proteobacteria bacterium]|nr:SHOCT domain-containing protein [Pseudomonadota bacterium]MBU4009785.1 SHOCT domain-containing protein [Pseudomonadota bacterium]